MAAQHQSLVNHMERLLHEQRDIETELNALGKTAEYMRTHERELHAQLARLNRMAVDANNANYNLEKQKVI